MRSMPAASAQATENEAVTPAFAARARATSAAPTSSAPGYISTWRPDGSIRIQCRSHTCSALPAAKGAVSSAVIARKSRVSSSTRPSVERFTMWLRSRRDE